MLTSHVFVVPQTFEIVIASYLAGVVQDSEAEIASLGFGFLGTTLYSCRESFVNLNEQVICFLHPPLLSLINRKC